VFTVLIRHKLVVLHVTILSVLFNIRPLCLLRMEWHPSGWSVCLPVNLPLHRKVQKFSSGTGLPGWSRKKGRKVVVCVLCVFNIRPHHCHMDSSVIFARWRQCAPHLIHGSLGQPESTSQTASRSVQSFCNSHYCDRPNDRQR